MEPALSRRPRHMTNEPKPKHAASERRKQLLQLLDDLEYHRATDVEYRLESAYRAEADARAIHAPDLQMRARLVQADMLQRVGRGAAAAATATDVNRWAREHGPRSLLARSHLILASIFENVGDSAGCLDNALRALELLDDITPPRTRGNFLARLADAFALIGSFDSARQRYREAEKIFMGIGDVERQLNVLNNLAYNEALSGNLELAAQTSEQLRSLAETGGIPLNPAFLDTLSRVHIGLGEYDEAEAELKTALEMLDRSGDVQAVTPAELTLTLAEVQRKQGRLTAAQHTLDLCREISVERSLAGMEVEVMREQAELHAAAGRFSQAYEAFKVYHARNVTLISSQREAAARTRQALFETAEARQEAQRYWRQARTDELTRLPNRRFVDEELPGLLSEVALGKPLVVAIVDADHFKRVNDTYSHEVGDQAIRELARILQATLAELSDVVVGGESPRTARAARKPVETRRAAAACADDDTAGPSQSGDGAVPAGVPTTLPVADTAFVARLGGEEFLVVLPGLDLRAAAQPLERLRHAVLAHDWSPIVRDVPMAISIGVAAAQARDTQSELLARADRCLYVAKRAGRDRVVVDRGVSR